MSTTFEKLPEHRKRCIIYTAFKEFATHGYKNASTNQIVKELGISKGILFKYFSTKLTLFTYLVDTTVNSLLEHLSKYKLEGNDWREILLSHSEVEFSFLIQEPTIYHFFYRIQKDINDPQLSSIKDDLVAKSNRYLKEIYQQTNLDPTKDKLLMEHISFILKGYNEQFVLSLNDKASEQDKERYIKGLKNHFELIGG